MPLRKLGSTNPACARETGGRTSAPSKTTTGTQTHRAEHGSIAHPRRLNIFTFSSNLWFLQPSRLTNLSRPRLPVLPLKHKTGPEYRHKLNSSDDKEKRKDGRGG